MSECNFVPPNGAELTVVSNGDVLDENGNILPGYNGTAAGTACGLTVQEIDEEDIGRVLLIVSSD